MALADLATKLSGLIHDQWTVVGMCCMQSCNKEDLGKVFANRDAVSVLCYAILMLNTDQYSSQVKKRMSLEVYILNIIIHIISGWLHIIVHYIDSSHTVLFRSSFTTSARSTMGRTSHTSFWPTYSIGLGMYTMDFYTIRVPCRQCTSCNILYSDMYT